MPISPQQLNGAMAWRYATKVFDPSRRIDDTTWAALEDALVQCKCVYGVELDGSQTKAELVEQATALAQLPVELLDGPSHP